MSQVGLILASLIEHQGSGAGADKVGLDAAYCRKLVTGLCRAFGDLTGEQCFEDAARRLIGPRPGRRPVDDSAALDYAKSLLEAKLASSPYAACSRAAVLYSGNQQIATTRERLRKKFRAKYCSQ